jgi:hypothetical protein
MMASKPDLYNHDFYAWTQQQAALLRESKVHDLDCTNLAEEIESLGRSEKRELGNRLHILVMHLLKWRYQPEGHVDSHSCACLLSFLTWNIASAACAWLL